MKILKHPIYSLLNISAITLSMSVCMVILYVIYNQFDYDWSNLNRNRIFRFNTEVEGSSGDRTRYATSPYAVTELLDSNIFDISIVIIDIVVVYLLITTFKDFLIK